MTFAFQVPSLYAKLHAPSRREVLLASGTLFAWAFAPKIARAEGRDPRLLTIVLRGALDGLAAVPPHGDKDYSSVRGSLALVTDGTTPLHDMDGFFGLHPALANMKTMYDAKELAVFHNICSPYRDRSHFDGQNVLETGATGPHLLQDGWLNRALKPMGMTDGSKRRSSARRIRRRRPCADHAISRPATGASLCVRIQGWSPSMMTIPCHVAARYPILRCKLAGAGAEEFEADLQPADKWFDFRRELERARERGRIQRDINGIGFHHSIRLKEASRLRLIGRLRLPVKLAQGLADMARGFALAAGEGAVKANHRAAQENA